MLFTCKSPDINQVRIKSVALCHKCPDRPWTWGVQHTIDCTPDDFPHEAHSWNIKHPVALGHTPEFITTKRTIPARFRDWMYQKIGIAPWVLNYEQNNNLKLEYDTLAAFTISAGSLASSTTAGRSGASVANSSTKMIDYRLSGYVKTGASAPTVDTPITLFMIGTLDDSSLWPDVFAGTDAAKTVTNSQMVDRLPVAERIRVAVTTAQTYPFQNCRTLAECLGIVPKNFQPFLMNSIGQALDTTNGNTVLNYQGIYFTV